MEEVGKVLKQFRLERFLEGLQNLGVENVDDLRDVERDDLLLMGMTKVQRNRFRRMVNPSEASFLSSPSFSGSCSSSDMEDTNSIGSSTYRGLFEMSPNAMDTTPVTQTNSPVKRMRDGTTSLTVLQDGTQVDRTSGSSRRPVLNGAGVNSTASVDVPANDGTSEDSTNEDLEAQMEDGAEPVAKKAKPAQISTGFGLKYIVLQQALMGTVWDLNDLDPETVTVANVIDLIVKGEGADPSSTTAELYTKEGVPLTNDTHLKTWSLRRRCIANGSLIIAILCRTGLKHCSLLPADGEKSVSPLNPDIQDCHTIVCQLESGDTFPIKVDLERHGRDELRFKIEEATGIPSKIQQIRIPSSDSNYTYVSTGSLAEQGLWDNDRVVVCPCAKPDGEHRDWDKNFSCDVKPMVEQTDKGMQTFASVLYVVAEKELEEDMRGAYLMGLIRRLTCWSPLIAALHTLNQRKPLITAEKIAIVEGLYFLFRQILQKPGEAGTSASPTVNDDCVFEYAAECWAYLLKSYEHRDATSEVYNELSLLCANTNKRLVQPVRVSPKGHVFDLDEVKKCMKENKSLKDHVGPITEANICPALDVQALLICNPEKEHISVWSMTVGSTLPDSRPQPISSRSEAELKSMHQDILRLQLWPPLQIKARVIEAPCLTLNKQKQPVVFSGFCKSIDAPCYLYNPSLRTTETVSLDSLAEYLEDVKFPNVTGEMATNSSVTRTPLEAIVVLLDTSYSMDSHCFGSTMTRIAAVKELFYAFADRSMAYNFPHLIGLTSFSSGVAVRGECSELFEKFKRVLEPAQPDGNTALFDAIWVAAVQLQKIREEFPDCRRRILCLTDGEDNCSKASALETVQFLQEEEIVLDAVQIGDMASELKSCAYASGGFCFKPKSLSDGRKIFEMETILSIRTRKQSTPPRRKVRSWNGLGMYSGKRYATKVEHRTPAEVNKPAAHAYAVLHKEAKKKTPPPLKSLDRTKRILRELSALQRDPHPAFSVYPSEANIGFWRMLLAGPVDTPYARGVFSMYLEFPENYPICPPQVRFLTPVYHCNINSIGRICHSVFDRNYTSDTSVKTILSCVYGLMMTPEPKDPLDGVLAEEYFTNKEIYNAKATEWTLKHANKTLEQSEKALLGGSTLPSRPLPSVLVCPLTKQLFVDPVQTPFGHVYERHAIETHLSTTCTDPIAKEPLVSADLQPAATVKRQVAEFRASQAKVSAWWQSS